MGKRAKRWRRWESAELNNLTYQDYYFRLRSVALNRFKWEGLPDTVDERFLERSLFERGYILFFKDPVMGYLTLNANLGGEFNVYDIPVTRRAYASNGKYNHTCSEKDSVIIWNNYNHLSDVMTTNLFAYRLSELQRTTDVNIIGQKVPKIITANEQQRLTMRQLYMQWDGNEPFIFGDKGMMGDIGVDVLDTTAPYVADKLEVQKHNYINEYLTYLGIENQNADKKERLVASESGATFGMVSVCRNAYLNAREQACEEINRMFGLNVSVKFKEDAALAIEQVTPYNKEGGGENG